MVARIGESKNSRRILVKNISSEMSTWNTEMEGSIKVVFERYFLTFALELSCSRGVVGTWVYAFREAGIH